MFSKTPYQYVVFGLKSEEGTISICVLSSEIETIDGIKVPLALFSLSSTIELISVMVVPSRFSNAKFETTDIPDANGIPVDPSSGVNVSSACGATLLFS